MDKTWVVVADEGRANVYEVTQSPKPDGSPRTELAEVETLTWPSAHADEADLRRDAQGRFYGKGEQMMGHTAPPRTDPLEKEGELFARRVADWLADARGRGRYAALHLIAAPKFLGRLRPLLPPPVQSAVVHEEDKDLSGMSRHELAQRLFPGRG
ncbi:MAG TPA: host attachment protein [Burkholderiaceae bacterium]|nr:host attachment protein [Burkholderiaceae bacterium]